MLLPPTTSFDIEVKVTRRFEIILHSFVVTSLLVSFYVTILGRWCPTHLGSYEVLLYLKIAFVVFWLTYTVLWFFVRKVNITCKCRRLTPKSAAEAKPFSKRSKILLCLIAASVVALIATHAFPILFTQIYGLTGKWTGRVTGKATMQIKLGHNYFLNMAPISNSIDIPQVRVDYALFQTAFVGDTVTLDGVVSGVYLPTT